MTTDPQTLDFLKHSFNEVLGIKTFCNDIQDQKTLKRELEKEQSFIKSLITSVHTIVLVIDIEGKIVTFNPFMEELSGYKLGEITGKDWFTTFLPECDCENMRNLFKKAIGGIQAHRNINPIITKDGSIRYIEWYDRMLKDLSGITIGLLYIGHDITERKKMEDAIKNRNIDLEIAVRNKENEMTRLMQVHIRQEKLAAIGQISGNIAHEIRNPLGVIKKSVYFLKKRIDAYPTKVQEHLELIDQQLTNVNQVIINMIKLCHTSSISNSKTFLLSSAIKESMIRCQLPERITLVCDSASQNVEIFADMLQFQQVMVNLISNAIHAIADRGEIKIDAYYLTDNSFCCIQVTDNGIGIKPEILGRVFDPLFSTKENGTGLGLGICKQIVEKHKGKIQIESKINQGTKVTFTLPMENNKSSVVDKN